MAYPDIGGYAVIGDCRTATLIARDGSLAWLWLPHFRRAFGIRSHPRPGAGRRTPLTTLLAQLCYGAVIGVG